MRKFDKLIPLDKSWLTRVGVLDIINGYTDIEKFIDSQKDTNDDILAIKNASIAWRNNQQINVGESATLYRLLKFASWKFKLNKTFIKRGSLKDRKITDNHNIVNFNQTKLLKLDNETTQWATAAVICGDKEKLTNPPLKLKESYDAVEHWEIRRKRGLCWEPKYDKTIERQVKAFLDLLNNKETNYTPLCSDDYCFARVFNFINKESGAKLWPSLIGHETNRIEEMEGTMMKADEIGYVNSKDHRVVQALAMWGVVNNKKLIFKNPNSVNKSWPRFWDFLVLAKRKEDNYIDDNRINKFGVKYAKDILHKTKIFANMLNKELNVVGPLPSLTNTHQICIDVPNIVQITQKLASIGIITLPMRIPSKNRSGLRLGIQELCRLGLKNKDLQILSQVIVTCVKEKEVSTKFKDQFKSLAKRLNDIKYILPYKKYF